MKNNVPKSSKRLSPDENEVILQKYNWPLMVKRTIQEFQGICGAIIYDKKVTDDEINMLKDYLVRCEDYLNEWPLNEFNTLFKDILADGIVTDKERLNVLTFLEKIAVGPNSENLLTGVFTENPNIEFRGKTFMFTGKLQFGKRQKAEDEVLRRGGVVSLSGFKDLDYLVVGIEGNEQWKYSRYGSKIEKVMNLKEKNEISTSIIKESDFIKAIITKPVV